jgi:hypothetical protein
LLGLFLINLAVGIVIGLALPGTAYVTPTGPNSGVNATEYEQHFNSTQIADSWEGTPFSGIPIVGDIFAGFSYLYQNLQYIIDGLPKFLLWIEETYIPDSTGQLAFEVIANALRAIYAFLIAIFFIELISGRIFSD